MATNTNLIKIRVIGRIVIPNLRRNEYLYNDYIYYGLNIYIQYTVYFFIQQNGTVRYTYKILSANGSKNNRLIDLNLSPRFIFIFSSFLIHQIRRYTS